MKKSDDSFETDVERSLKNHLAATKAGDPERTKALAVSVRYLAVKAKLILPESGEGLEDI